MHITILRCYYGRPLSVSGRPCYILPMFLFIYFFLWPPYSPALVNGRSRKFYTVYGRFAPLMFRPLDVLPLHRTFRPLDVSPPGRFAPKTFRPLDVSPPGYFAPWTFRPQDVSPPVCFAPDCGRFAPVSGLFVFAPACKL